MADCVFKSVIQTLLGPEDVGQFSEKIFGANDEAIFDIINAEKRKAKNAQRKEKLQREQLLKFQVKLLSRLVSMFTQQPTLLILLLFQLYHHMSQILKVM
jgi:hypothetical protein